MGTTVSSKPARIKVTKRGKTVHHFKFHIVELSIVIFLAALMLFRTTMMIYRIQHCIDCFARRTKIYAGFSAIAADFQTRPELAGFKHVFI